MLFSPQKIHIPFHSTFEIVLKIAMNASQKCKIMPFLQRMQVFILIHLNSKFSSAKP